MKLKRILRTLILISVVSLTSLCSAAALKCGDRGDAVKEIQEYLIAQNLLHVAADGVYGSSTVAAIKDFQEALGLEVDGVCGALTYKLLRAAAYDEIDITTYKLGDYVPEHVDEPEPAPEPVKEVVQYAGVGDVIKLGMEGEGVVYLQNKLIERGYYEGEAHGICDAATVGALKAFQRIHGMTADGICGRATYAELEKDVETYSDDADYSDTETYSDDADYSDTETYGDDSDDNGDIPRYSRVVRVEATAYSSMEDGMGAYTATGTLCRRGVIATDPNFIPLGTRVFIPGYGYAVAEDTGGAIVGNIIDIAFDTVGECYEWGRQYINIYILD